VDGGGLRAVVGHGDAPEQVFRRAFRDFLHDIEVAPVVEHAHVGEFEFRAVAAELLVFLADLGVGILRVGILVERLGVGMGGGGIEVVVTFLHVLAVVALVAAEAEEALLEDGVLAVPERGGETQAALAVGPALEAVLAPAVGAAARVVVGKRGPAVAVVGIVLAHGSPLALAEEGPPAPPARKTPDSAEMPGAGSWFRRLRYCWRDRR
jgi:hypothetical protein